MSDDDHTIRHNRAVSPGKLGCLETHERAPHGNARRAWWQGQTMILSKVEPHEGDPQQDDRSVGEDNGHRMGADNGEIGVKAYSRRGGYHVSMLRLFRLVLDCERSFTRLSNCNT